MNDRIDDKFEYNTKHILFNEIENIKDRNEFMKTHIINLSDSSYDYDSEDDDAEDDDDGQSATIVDNNVNE